MKSGFVDNAIETIQYVRQVKSEKVTGSSPVTGAIMPCVAQLVEQFRIKTRRVQFLPYRRCKRNRMGVQSK